MHALVKDVMTTHVVAVRSDASYREMAALILDGFFTDPARLTVTVRDGIVTLEGSPGSVVLGRGIVDQARHVEGVVAVRDRFTYPLTAQSLLSLPELAMCLLVGTKVPSFYLLRPLPDPMKQK
jgi:hypothetical protein